MKVFLGTVSLCLLVIFLAGFWGFMCGHTYGHDWTGMDDPALAGWFMSLHRKADNMSCCGLGDAYMVVITKMPDPYQAESGEFEITDGRALEVEGVKRPAIPEGTVFRFSHLHFTNEKSGNPTPSAWAFINSNGVVYCVVPLPPSF